MKIRFLFLLTLVLFVGCNSADADSNDIPEFKLPTPIPLADPYILYEDGTYYLYGTGSGDGIAVAVSKDMRKWEWPENEKYYLALHKDNSYGTYYFWAPEVYKVGDKYLMYYSSQEHICAAWGDSPLGPFKQVEKKPMRDPKGIDNHLFIDDDGKPYLFWVHFSGGQQVWVAELENDYTTIIPGTETKCISPVQDWEMIWATVNEGPFVLKHEGKYYLSYSANTYESQHYAIGYAVSDSPKGPWVKYHDNPILHQPAGLVGTGHPAFFKDKDGTNRITFHSHNKAGQIHPRILHIGTYGFENLENEDDRLYVDKAFFTPHMY